MRYDLRAGFSDVQWVVDAYALSLAGLVSLPGAALALLLVREREIEREPTAGYVVAAEATSDAHG